MWEIVGNSGYSSEKNLYSNFHLQFQSFIYLVKTLYITLDETEGKIIECHPSCQIHGVMCDSMLITLRMRYTYFGQEDTCLSITQSSILLEFP